MSQSMVGVVRSAFVAAMLKGTSGLRPANMQASDLGANTSEFAPKLGLKAGDGLGNYHLSPDGAKACDFGTTITETYCKEVGEALLRDMKITPGRDYMVAGPFKNAPPGCSLHTSMDFAVVYNSATDGQNDGTFAPVCHGKKEEVHSVRLGEDECDFGQALMVDKCLDAANNERARLHGAESEPQRVVNVGHWGTLPHGCSIHVGAGGENAKKSGSDLVFFNTKKDGKNDGSYVLLCTGTVVPER